MKLDYATPKVITFVGLSSRDPAARDLLQTFHFSEWYRNPTNVVICIDPNQTNEELIAHELMHPWFHYYEGYEDYRMPREDLSPALNFMIISIQSMIIDQRITQRLEQRGSFNTHFFAADMADMLYENHLTFQMGLFPRNRIETLALAHCFSPLFFAPENFDFTLRERGMVNAFKSTCRKLTPDILNFAERLAEQVTNSGYRNNQELRSAVDGCLQVCFNYLGLEFNANEVFVPAVESITYWDKPVGMLDGIPPQIKHEILKEWVKRGEEKMAMRVNHDPQNRRVQVAFFKKCQ